MLKALILTALVAASGCTVPGTSARRDSPPTNPAPSSTRVQAAALHRAAVELRRAQFGPPGLSAHGQLLHHIRCAPLAAGRIRCRTTWHGHPATPIVFGVHGNGSLYVIVAGPLAIG